MKKYKNTIIILLLIPLSACQLFLGPEPDTSPKAIFYNLWNDFNNIHANLDLRMSSNPRYNNWQEVYDYHSNNLKDRMTDNDLFELCLNMLKVLNDPHVSLHAPGRNDYSYTDTNPEHFYLSEVKKHLTGSGSEVYKNFLYGKFTLSPHIGYIHIKTFTPETYEWGRAIDRIIRELSDTKAIVLDIRNNSGGEIQILEFIVSRFIAERKDYMTVSVKSGPEPNSFSAPVVYTARPSGSNYTKPVVLITNKGTVSAAERFTLALRTQSHVIHTGTTTLGALSKRHRRPMANGWFYSISPERSADMNGKIYEGIGISPTDFCAYGPEDKQLIRALELAETAVNSGGL